MISINDKTIGEIEDLFKEKSYQKFKEAVNRAKKVVYRLRCEKTLNLIFTLIK